MKKKESRIDEMCWLQILIIDLVVIGAIALSYVGTICNIDRKLGASSSIRQKLDTSSRQINQKLDTIDQKLDTSSRQINQKLDASSRQINQKLNASSRQINQKIDTVVTRMDELIEKIRELRIEMRRGFDRLEK